MPILKKSFASRLVFSFVAGLLVLFQNCSPVNFHLETQVEELASGNMELSCDSNLRPANEEILACPKGTAGTGAIRSRNVVCDGNNWTASAWTNPNYSSCFCAVSGQTINPISGVCECPTGQVESGNKCIVPTCDPATRPSNLELGTCPSGIGSSKRTRTVLCDSQNQLWQTNPWTTWDYSGCSCPAIGQTLNPTTGACTCPIGEEVIAGRCQVRTCDPAAKPLTLENITCPSGAGTATRSRTVTCPSGSTLWSTGTWMNNYAGCTCPISGQTLNLQTGTCTCPSGQVVVNGACVVPTCDPTAKPSEFENLACPSGLGTAYRSRTVSCPSGSLTWIAGAWTTNFSQCVCAVTGQIPNSATGVCACPAGQIVQNGSCRNPTCDPTTQAPLSQNLNCPNNSLGTYTQTRTATCDPSTLQYTYSAWIANDSICSCPYAGQTFNTSTKTCACPADQTVVNGQCSAPVNPTCPQPAPSDKDYMQCPSGAGTASRTNSVTCPAGSTVWSVSYGTWNYSSCGCLLVGGQVNAANGTCSCAGGTYEISGKCGTCPSGTTYDSTSKTCQMPACPAGSMRSSVGVGCYQLYGWYGTLFDFQGGNASLPIYGYMIGNYSAQIVIPNYSQTDSSPQPKAGCGLDGDTLRCFYPAPAGTIDDGPGIFSWR